MAVSKHLEAAFTEARARYAELGQLWVAMSHRVGSRLPSSLLLVSIQRAGELDLVIRCLEDELKAEPAEEQGPESMFLGHHLRMFSELWIGDLYETFRVLRDRALGDSGESFESIFRDLELLRITIDKHEIPKDKQLKAPLKMTRFPASEPEEIPYTYDKKDPKRAHIMPSGLSERGSYTWHVMDHRNERNFWLERRDISDRIVELWKPLAQ